MSRRYNFLALAVLAAAIMFFGCVITPNRPSNATNNTTQANQTPAQNLTVNNTILNGSSGGNATDVVPIVPVDCSTLAGQAQSNCYISKAANTTIPSDCNLIPDQAARQMCLERIAEKSGTAALCDYAQDNGSKYQCYRNLAISRNDTAICDRIPDALNYQLCYYIIAQKTGNPALCGKINLTTRRESCINDSTTSP